MTIADRPKKRAGHAAHKPFVDVTHAGPAVFHPGEGLRVESSRVQIDTTTGAETEYTLRGVDMPTDEAVMNLHLSDALGVTGLDWDGMVDLVRERSMLARVRDAHGDPEMSAQGGEHTGWSVCHGSDRGEADAVAHGGTEQDALQSALECAP